MFKKIAIILVLVLVIGALLIAAFWDEIHKPRLNSTRKQQISEACAKQGIAPVNWNVEGHESGAVRYYGNFDGYDVFLLYPEDCRYNGDHFLYLGYTTVRIAVKGCELYAYKDGEVNTVLKLYEDGLLSRDAMQKICDQHQEFDNVKEIEGWGSVW